MEDNNINNYLKMMNKIIKHANPKYMSFVSREYMKYSSNSPVIAETILEMIRKEVNKNEQSPYAIFIDDDGSVNLDAMNDISKISNLPQFINQVQSLAKYNIDFSEMSADDLIKEADQIVAELEEKIDNELNKTDISSSEVSNAERNVETGIVKLGLFTKIGIIVTTAITRIKTKLSELKNKSKQPEEKTEKIESPKPITSQEKNSRAFEEVCQRVQINERAIIEEMKDAGTNPNKALNTDTYGDGDPDGDDLNK